MNFIDTLKIFSPFDARDFKAETTLTVDELPNEFELDNLPVKNQGDVGSCVAHATSELVEYINRRQEGSYVKMSTGYIYGNREYETTKLNGGYYTRLAMKVLKNRGDCSYDSFPYNIKMPAAEELYLARDKSIDDEAYRNRISSYFRITDDDTAKALLMDDMPIVCSLYWDSSVKYDKNYLLSFPNSKKAKGGHCVLIVGWNENGWIIQNSWGRNWGKAGRATIPYNAPIKEMWGATDDIINGDDINFKKPGKFAKIIQSVINFFRALFKK